MQTIGIGTGGKGQWNGHSHFKWVTEWIDIILFSELGSSKVVCKLGRLAL